MRRALKVLLVGGPAVIMVVLVGSNRIPAWRIDASLPDPARVVWGQGDSEVRVKVTEQEEGEALTFRVEAHDARGRRLAEKSLVVNRDMWGAGFARGMQVDDDPELEVVAWGHYEQDKTSFYLDYSEGWVTVRPFTEASAAARELARNWHQVNRMDVFGLFVLGFLAFLYYVVLGLVWLVILVVRRARPSQ